MSDTWIVGIHPVEAALQHDAGHVVELRTLEGGRNPRVAALAERARASGIVARSWPRRELDHVAGKGVRHQGVAVRYRAPAAWRESDLPRLVEQAGSSALLLVLDGVTDPHNLGACLRSAAAAGVDAVIVPRDRAVGMTPTVRRASAGGADRVPLVVVANLARALRQLKEAGVWLTGLAGEASTSVYASDFTGPTALLLGAEGDGLRRLTRAACDYLASIPMPGTMESLNVSVATGVVLFEAVRQREAQRLDA